MPETYPPLQPSDTAALHRMVSDWTLVRQLGSWPWPPDPAFTASRARPFEGDGFVDGIVVDGTLAGTIGIFNTEIGYMLSPEFRGQGIARRAAAMALARAYGPMDLDRVVANAWADNGASIGLLRSLGFTETGRTTEPSVARKRNTPGVTLCLDRKTWEAAQRAPL